MKRNEWGCYLNSVCTYGSMLTGVASLIAESTGGVISLLSEHIQTKRLCLDSK